MPLVHRPERNARRPESIALARGQVLAWLGYEMGRVPGPGERLAELLGAPLAQPGIHANLVPDAYLAALALEHGLTLYSTDGEFARFPRLRWSNPQ